VFGNRARRAIAGTAGSGWFCSAVDDGVGARRDDRRRCWLTPSLDFDMRMSSRFFEAALAMVFGIAGARYMSAQSQPDTTRVRLLEAQARSPTARSAQISTLIVTGELEQHHARRAQVIGAVAGAVIGGLVTAGFVLNATATDCITNGPPCPKKNYTFLHVVTISTGTLGGAFLGSRVARWLAR
jgi:hypothetical protein